MGGSQGGPGLNPTPGKSQVVIGFLRNTGTDPHREAIGPFSRAAHTAFCEIRC